MRIREGKLIIKKKDVYGMFYILGAVVASYLGYLYSGAYAVGYHFFEIMERYEKVLQRPFDNYWNENSIELIVIFLFLYFILITTILTSKRKTMRLKEYGTAEFQDNYIAKERLGEENGYERLLTKNVSLSMDTRKTKLNNNVLVIGGSGAGKTLFMCKPNILKGNTSMVITDPKGEILSCCGAELKRKGFRIKVLNLVDMDKSDCYNPFAYIREENDVIRLITNIIRNTTPKNANPNDPFWEKAESLYLQALFYYVWLEMPEEKRNFNTFMKMLTLAEVHEDGKKSPLDTMMDELAKRDPRKRNHPAVKQYDACVKGAGDTVRSIFISANARFAYLENEKVKRILSRDDMDIASLGMGYEEDKQTKTALFCVIPDADTSYNFIVGMLYTQIFQELYFVADNRAGGRLPVPVTFYLDEFANVALPDMYCNLLSTMRSREISSVIVIQNLAQIKAMFKDTWETIPGNCDTLLYLGGNEQSTHKYISELLGKATIEKKSMGLTKGTHGSSSQNFDVLGRELLTADEVRMLDNRKCLLFIRGVRPIMDDKIDTFHMEEFKRSGDGDGEKYVHSAQQTKEDTIRLLSEDSLAYFEDLKNAGENVRITTLAYETFMNLKQKERTV